MSDRITQRSVARWIITVFVVNHLGALLLALRFSVVSIGAVVFCRFLLLGLDRVLYASHCDTVIVESLDGGEQFRVSSEFSRLLLRGYRYDVRDD